MTLKQISKHVWIMPFLKGENIMQANIGVIIGADETVLIDAGNGAPQAVQIQQALQELGAPPVRQIIYTHHHWDHVFGAYLFDVPVVANRRSAPFLQEKAQIPWGEPYFQERWETMPRTREEITSQRQAAGNWKDLRIVMPDVVFDEFHTLLAADVTLQMWHVGGVHASDSIVVQVVEDGVMFVGDSFYAPPTYEMAPGKEDVIAIDVIGHFLREDVNTYIDGHNKPYSARQMKMLVRWQLMQDELKKKV
ncbi:MAG: MBL fold metallo-hydrolase [Chloroflexi bacterium]|nr:MBL fold metallo-hydrolase [Chloroflexota bacterium]